MERNEKATVLIEALPYLQRYRGKTIVVKYGGNAMIDDELKASFAKDLTLLQLVGLKVVVVHGGGPQIGSLLDRLGIASHFVGGMRVTDDETMDVVEMVLAGLVNKEIVALLQQQGARAVGLSGKDGGLLKAARITLEVPMKEGPPEIIDPGRVGEIESVDCEILETLDQSGFVPVVAPVGLGEDGRALNINADLVAGALAVALKAERLLLLTDVAGLLDGDGLLVGRLDLAGARALLESEFVSGGMIPKLRCCVDAVESGVGAATMIDGRVPHAVLLELLTDQGVGTVVRSG
ncbi:MAG: acetylglutamate kinase [Deltaproteobacteria bacterium]|nr:acetylglutamate kinase [Deltaproteobacteria bacterium]